MSLKYILKIGKKIPNILITFLIILCSTSVHSTVTNIGNDRGFDYEAYTRNLSTYEVDSFSSDYMGDKMDKTTGTIAFEYIDIDIPGNSELEVQLRRRVNTVFSGSPLYDELSHHFYNGSTSSFMFKHGIVTFDTPRITYHLSPTIATSPLPFQTKAYCTGKSFAMAQGLEHFNNGYNLIIPGKVNEKILKNDNLLPGSSSPYSTKSGWKISCTDNEGFEATSPKGVKYTFGFHEHSIPTQQGITDYSMTSVFRDLIIYVTKVEDRFGNWVKYTYGNREQKVIRVLDNFGNPVPLPYYKADLKKIISNDGREIIITRTPDGATVSANGKIWKYENHGGRVIRPDGKTWRFSWFESEEKKTPHEIAVGKSIKRYITPGTNNGRKGGNKYACKRYNYSSYLEIKHPDGAIGKFLIGESLQGDTEVDSGYEVGSSWISTPRCYSYPSLIKKTIQYSKNEEYTWNYEYSNNWGSYDKDTLKILGFHSDEPTIFDKQLELAKIQLSTDTHIPSNLNRNDYKTVKTTQPDGSYIIDYIDRNYISTTYGKIITSRVYDAEENLLKETQNRYSRGVQFGRELPGLQWNFNKTVRFESNIDLTSTQQSIFHNGGNVTYTNQYGDMNEYGKYTTLHESNSFNNKVRHYKYAYLNDTENWVLSKLSSVEISSNGSDYIEIERTSFHSTSGIYKGLPNCHYINGLQVNCNLSYWTGGNSYSGKPRKININSNNYRWIEYGDYKRGIPQTIKKPNQTGSDSVNAYISVDNNGWVRSFTDYEGNCTEYDYNEMGRKTLISPCTLWEDTHIDYATTDGSEELQHVQPGMIKQSVSRGNYHKTTYFDSMLRPRLVKEWDNNTAATTRYSRSQFDHNNRPTFQSKLDTNSSTPYGINISYDALGRTRYIDDNTTPGQVSYNYLTNNQVATFDTKGNVTSTTYLAYGSPTRFQPTLIESPEGVDTTFVYNIHGNVNSITQNGLTEYRVYDFHQGLCKTIRADTGNTAYNYNVLGELQWVASGSSVSGSKTSCDNVVSNTEKTQYLYDNLGNIETINYGDSSPDKTFTYDNNGNLKTISAGSVSHRYHYNSANLLELESLSVDEKTFNLDYVYNSSQHLISLIYPNGHKVDFSPNAFGQSTKAGGYATNASYYPNGTIKSYIYGNGFIHSTSLNSDGSGLPERIRDYKGSAKAFDHKVGFDSNGNMEYLKDNLNPAYNLDLLYDGLDRLETIVDSYNGSGHIDYDEMGNIEYYKLGSQTIDYHYDSKNRLDRTSGDYITDFSYDSRGNVNNNGRNQTMIYNLAQQITSSTSNGKSLSFIYDGNDKRTVKNVNGEKTYFVYGRDGQLLHRIKKDGTAVNNIYLAGKLIAKVEAWEPPPPVVHLTLDVIFDNNIDLELGCPIERAFRYDKYCIDFTKDEPIKHYHPDLFEASDKAVKITWETINAKSCEVLVKTFTGFSPNNTKTLMEINNADELDGIYLPVNSSLNYSVHISCYGDEGFGGASQVWVIENGEEREFL